MDGLSAIARELRVARENLKLTREKLAEEIGYTASYIEKIETGKLAATDPYIAAAGKVLGDGINAAELFGRLRDDERREVVPAWFRPWIDHEQEATEIRWFEPLVVPGLLQLEAYAEELLEDTERVTFRMTRQQILDRTQVTVVILETVLSYRVGTPEIMCKQLEALAQSSAAVQVLPVDADTHLAVDGSFALATVDGSEVAYADAPVPVAVTTDPGVVSECRRRWDVIGREALPRRQSRDLILKVAEERWRTRT